MGSRRNLLDRVVDRAVERAEEVGWAHVRLHDIADDLGLGLSDLRPHFCDLNDVADAWFQRADMAMLTTRDKKGFTSLPPRERISAVINRWLDVQATHRGAVRCILEAKLYPGHPHHNAALLIALSRTVQWIREASGLDASGLRRQIEEIGLTALFTAVVFMWIRDESDGQIRTKAFLDWSLAGSDRLMARLFPSSGSDSEVDYEVQLN